MIRPLLSRVHATHFNHQSFILHHLQKYSQPPTRVLLQSCSLNHLDMSQQKQRDNKAASRSDYSANLATKFDPVMLASKTSAAGAPSSTAASQPSRPAPSSNIFRQAGYPTPSSTTSSQAGRKLLSQMSRQERILDVLGVPEANRPKKDSQPSSNASTAGAPTSMPSRAASGGQRLQTTRASSKPATAGLASKTAPFPCTYAECKRGFQNIGDLRIHKENEHDYCRTCDVDCEDFDVMHQHKIMSDKHICCTVCSMDFRSESGRDRHYILVRSSMTFSPRPPFLLSRLWLTNTDCRCTDQPTTSPARNVARLLPKVQPFSITLRKTCAVPKTSRA